MNKHHNHALDASGYAKGWMPEVPQYLRKIFNDEREFRLAICGRERNCGKSLINEVLASIYHDPQPVDGSDSFIPPETREWLEALWSTKNGGNVERTMEKIRKKNEFRSRMLRQLNEQHLKENL